ncbi:MAG: hypothetical protein RL540_1470 [Actinomycetota bacterium]
MRRLASVTALALLCSTLLPSSSNAVWEFESENKVSGITAYATTFWLEGTGPISIDQLMQVEDEVEEGTYWGSLMVSCTKRRLTIGVNLNMAGSGNREIILDDPGFAYLRMDSAPLRKYRTWATDIDSTIAFSSDAPNIAKILVKARTLSITVRDRVARERITLTFDVANLSKAKARFRYAGCKI